MESSKKPRRLYSGKNIVSLFFFLFLYESLCVHELRVFQLLFSSRFLSSHFIFFRCLPFCSSVRAAPVFFLFYDSEVVAIHSASIELLHIEQSRKAAFLVGFTSSDNECLITNKCRDLLNHLTEKG